MKNITPPTTPKDLAGHGERIYQVERRVNEVDDSPREVATSFTLAGPIYASTSPRYYHPEGAKLVRVIVALGTAGSGSTTLRVRRNGAAVGSLITLAAGANTTVALFSGVTLAADGDFLTVEVVSAGAGAEDLSVHARFG